MTEDNPLEDFENKLDRTEQLNKELPEDPSNQDLNAYFEALQDIWNPDGQNLIPDTLSDLVGSPGSPSPDTSAYSLEIDNELDRKGSEDPEPEPDSKPEPEPAVWFPVRKKPVEVEAAGPYYDQRIVETLEGDFTITEGYAEGGYYLIKGAEDEIYPCQYDIFHDTYDRPDEADGSLGGDFADQASYQQQNGMDTVEVTLPSSGQSMLISQIPATRMATKADEYGVFTEPGLTETETLSTVTDSIKFYRDILTPHVERPLNAHWNDAPDDAEDLQEVFDLSLLSATDVQALISGLVKDEQIGKRPAFRQKLSAAADGDPFQSLPDTSQESLEDTAQSAITASVRVGRKAKIQIHRYSRMAIQIGAQIYHDQKRRRRE